MIGNQSMYNEILHPMRDSLYNLCDIIRGFRETPELLVHNEKLYPCAYLHETLEQYLVESLHKALFPSNENTPCRPSEFKGYCQRLFTALAMVDEMIHLNLKEMIEKVMCDQFYYNFNKNNKRNLKNNIALNVRKSNDEEYSNKLIHGISKFYIQLLQRCYPNPNTKVMYCPKLKQWMATTSGGTMLEAHVSQKEIDVKFFSFVCVSVCVCVCVCVCVFFCLVFLFLFATRKKTIHCFCV